MRIIVDKYFNIQYNKVNILHKIKKDGKDMNIILDWCKQKILGESDERFNYITVLSVISAISVIILHTNGCFWTFSKESYWITANIIESMFYFAVPIFFMITGVTLLDYNLRYSEKEYANKRISKTFIPFLFWIICALVFKIVITKDIKTSELSFRYIWDGIFNTDILSIFWFFKNLFLVYLVIPILANVQQEKKIKLFSLYIYLMLALNVILPFINNIFKLEIQLPIYINIGCSSMLYVLIGYILSKKELKKLTRIIIYLLGIIGLLMQILLTQKLSFEAGKIIDTYRGYQNIPCIAYSISIFVFIKQITSKIKFKKIFCFLSKYTFEFYLMQYFIYTIIQRLTKWNTHAIAYRLGMPFIVILVTIIITLILRKIPILKKFVP